MIRPTRMLMLGLPTNASDVVIEVDGAQVVSAELHEWRAFLGKWKVSASPVDDAPLSAAVDSGAVLIEVPTAERDEDGRIEPIALWSSTPVPSDFLSTAFGFAERLGRSFDREPAVTTLRRAIQQQEVLRRDEGRSFFVRAVLRFLRALWRPQTARTNRRVTP
jgi:hypothetical protein